MNCIFCKIVAKEIPATVIFETEDSIVIPDIHPQAPQHLLVIPKKHVTNLLEADEKLRNNIFQTVVDALKQQNMNDFRVVTNGGKAAEIHHWHIHLLGKINITRTI